jgi:hypothetical protein
MLNRVTTGAASYAHPQTAFHKRDAGIPAANNALAGIRASRSQFIKRTATPEAADTGSVKWQPSVGAGATAAKRPTPAQAAIAAAAQSTAAAQPVDTVEISGKGYEALSKPCRKNGMYVALDQLEKYEYGRKILDKLRASDAGIEIDYEDGRAYVYVDGLSEEDRNIALYGHIGAIYGETAQPAAIDERSDEDRYADIELGFAIQATLKFNYDVDNGTSFKLAGELGRLLSAPNGTLEERTVNRAKGLELAKYFAENYITDPAAKQNFLDRAKEIANTSEMRDKGYDFRYNREDGTITVEKTDDDMLASWGKLTEKQATDIINKTKNSLDMNAVKQDAINTFKKIMANYMSADGTTLAAPKWLT